MTDINKNQVLEFENGVITVKDDYGIRVALDTFSDMSIFTYDKVEIRDGFAIIYNGFTRGNAYPKNVIEKTSRWTTPGEFAKKNFRQNSLTPLFIPESRIKFIADCNKQEWDNTTEEDALSQAQDYYNLKLKEWLKKGFFYKLFVDIDEYGSKDT